MSLYYITITINRETKRKRALQRRFARKAIHTSLPTHGTVGRGNIISAFMGITHSAWMRCPSSLFCFVFGFFYFSFLLRRKSAEQAFLLILLCMCAYCCIPPNPFPRALLHDESKGAD
jgi:hypothetical protein